MTAILVLPPLGESITQGTVAAWHVRVGDIVVTDQPVMSVQTQKVAVDIPSTIAGRVQRLLVPLNAVVRVGDPLVEFA